MQDPVEVAVAASEEVTRLRRKLWKTALRAGITVGRDRIERLMRLAGISGIRLGKRRTATTVSDPKAARHPDYVNRRWSWPSRRDQWWCTDFTYVWTPQGFCYVSFMTDVYSRRVLGWRVMTPKTTKLVLSALEQALFTRRRTNVEFTTIGLLHHFDAWILAVCDMTVSRSTSRRCG